MSNNRDDKYEGQDDSEYHFSDDEINYEVESETPQASPAAREEQGSRISRLPGSKRIFIILGVMIAIVYVVYRVFLPSSSSPAVDITTAPTVTETTMPSNQAAPAKPLQTPQVAAAPAAPAPAAAPTSAPAPAPVAAAAPVVPALPGQAVPSVTEQQQPAATAPVATLPPIIPVQSAVPANVQSPLANMATYVEEKSAALSTTSQQTMAQIQSQYTQQFNEFSAQNKSLQNQVQSLNARVVEMETQINQMVQILTRRNNSGSGNSMNAEPLVQQARSPQVKIAYNVQAIIPGRAWLKSDNGETLTVAEGDVIRDVGRVTKIDPYDGVVEISTGTKSVSLSYGNGG